MAFFKLPDPLVSWAWSADYLAKSQETSPSGLILPTTSTDDRPAFVHFSKMADGGEKSWLWLFPDPREALALRTLQVTPGLKNDPLAQLVALTIPRLVPDCPRATYVQVVDVAHLGGLPLEEMGIHEVWIGFDYTKYAADRIPALSTQACLSAAEFCAIARR